MHLISTLVPNLDGSAELLSFFVTLPDEALEYLSDRHLRLLTALFWKVTASEVTETGVKLTMEPSKGGASTTMEADVVLVATGRRPYTANLGCDELGISLDKMGRIEVDSHFRTAVPSVYAIGDCIAGPMLAHKAEEEGIACVETIAGFAGHVNYDAIPGVVYTHPELAEVRSML